MFLIQARILTFVNFNAKNYKKFLNQTNNRALKPVWLIVKSLTTSPLPICPQIMCIHPYHSAECLPNAADRETWVELEH
jgi:hypothetical protein